MAIKARWKNSRFALPLCSPLPFHPTTRTGLGFEPGCMCVEPRQPVNVGCCYTIDPQTNTPVPIAWRMTIECAGTFDNPYCTYCTPGALAVLGTHTLTYDHKYSVGGFCQWQKYICLDCPDGYPPSCPEPFTDNGFNYALRVYWSKTSGVQHSVIARVQANCGGSFHKYAQGAMTAETPGDDPCTQSLSGVLDDNPGLWYCDGAFLTATISPLF